MPSIGECTEGKIEGKKDIVPPVLKLIVLLEGDIKQHATITKCAKSYHRGRRVVAVHSHRT